MDMAKYVAVGVLAVIVLAAVTYEAPPDPRSAEGPQVTGTLGGGTESEPSGTGSVAATVERGTMGAITLPASSPAPVTSAVTTPSTPVRDELLSYTIKAGQTLSDVAGELLGNRGRWREVYEQNKDKIPDPNRVRAGITVVFPAALRTRGNQTTTTSSTPEPQLAAVGGGPTSSGEGRSYVVKQGDTLYSIAKRELGKASRWKEIAQLNGIDGSSLVAGKSISLPR